MKDEEWRVVSDERDSLSPLSFTHLSGIGLSLNPDKG
jgi:hypothetical protein